LQEKALASKHFTLSQNLHIGKGDKSNLGMSADFPISVLAFP
jgi:hypothetical protein